jgi:hypothetical protein
MRLMRIRLAAFFVLALAASTAVAQDDLSTFHACHPQGTARLSHVKQLDSKKNRFDLPGQHARYSRISLADVVRRVPDADRFPEGVPGEVVGWVRLVKPGSPETCNCGQSSDESLMDTRFALTPRNRLTGYEIFPLFHQQPARNSLSRMHPRRPDESVW